MMGELDISVVIPCYNAERYLGEALTSVLAQTHAPAQIIVVDDGSTDESVAVATRFGDRIHVIRQRNAGDCAARNAGMAAASASWIAFLDADDRWHPQKLAKQLAAIATRPEVVCVHTGAYRFGEGCVGAEEVEVLEEIRLGRYEFETLLLLPLVNTSSALVRRAHLPRFPEGARQGGDLVYFCELSEYGRFAYVAEPLTGYRMHRQQVTKRAAHWPSNFQVRFDWLDRVERRIGMPRAESLRALLRAQVLEWLRLARWNRQWDRYRELRQYATTLDWGGTIPTELVYRVYPEALYKVKDFIDVVTRSSSTSNIPTKSGGRRQNEQ